MNHFHQKHILDMTSLSVDEIDYIIKTATTLKEISERPIKKVPTLRGKSIVHFFHEPSTRTRTSFEIAAKRMSADTFSISASTSSMTKGETLFDTVNTLQAMNPDIIVMRHSASGAPHFVSRHLEASVINAGDGMHAHPTQCLLDLMTAREALGKIKGLKLAIIGDIFHSRVARSNIIGFTKMGASVTVAAPLTMIPEGIDRMGARVAKSLEDAISDADIIMALRIQKERQSNFFFPTEREYANFFGLTYHRLKEMNSNAYVMHPGPINRGVELTSDVADCSESLIMKQVTNGVAIRMALLYLLMGGTRNAHSN
ncbi:MAG: Aspartate carbamoyltransferase [Candidatus Magnetoglobus multicellularis str. Araruama]|uniref:Aspartate carbamoyltransferase n=1 Tax=Candidatus Magnetoglobus multicellularis str. Araruama TaxID=890399 RepID=A0A1V1P8B4_9BACT|nr:MAG: Aspartate carbamoyltransferase [Candidatus Magnetoglobus multicellularis str. Araruama]